MLNYSKQPKPVPRGIGQPRTYKEVVTYLESLPVREYGPQVIERMQALDAALGLVSQQVQTILVAGGTGKSSAIHFASKLLMEENVTASYVYSSHLLTYNERIVLNTDPISNTDFTEIVSTVIDAAISHDIAATSSELMTMAGLIHARNNNVEVALLEVGIGGQYDATAICKACIVALTRVAHDSHGFLSGDLDAIAKETTTAAQQGAWFVSSEQSKLRLIKMREWAEDRGAIWSMPIRKLAPLPYIYEQLYGRTASLGERIAQIYVEDIKKKFSPFLRGNLCATQQGQRGRPTLAAKRYAELHPIKTLKSFWSESFALLRGRFEILAQEKPTVVLDTARNTDGMDNVFLGIRLLHYQSEINGLALVVGVSKHVNIEELLKMIRYLFKKVSGHVFFVPLEKKEQGYRPETLRKEAEKLRIPASAYKSAQEAFEHARASVSERDGVIAVTGSPSVVAQYWKAKGLKHL